MVLFTHLCPYLSAEKTNKSNLVKYVAKILATVAIKLQTVKIRRPQIRCSKTAAGLSWGGGQELVSGQGDRWEITMSAISQR